MKKRMKSVFCALLALMMLVCMAVPAFAADASVQYEGNAKKFISRRAAMHLLQTCSTISRA